MSDGGDKGGPPTAVASTPGVPPDPPVQGPQPQGVALPSLARGIREELPNRRRMSTFKAQVGAAPSIYLHVDEYPDGRVGAIFITMSKVGTFTNGIMDAFSSSVSLAIQYGAPLREIAPRFLDMIFEPNGMVTEGDSISHATSIVDWVFKTLTKEYPNQ